MQYTAETLAIARENLVSRGIFRPTVPEILEEASRMYEANKVPMPLKRLFPLLALAVDPVSTETIAEFIRKVLHL